MKKLYFIAALLITGCFKPISLEYPEYGYWRECLYEFDTSNYCLEYVSTAPNYYTPDPITEYPESNY
jgi:hypothetical protein